jgi:hypothetical protein
MLFKINIYPESLLRSPGSLLSAYPLPSDLSYGAYPLPSDLSDGLCNIVNNSV